MWYLYLNRDQLYMRNYRTHNLWLDMYSKKTRTPRVHAFHLGLLKRLSKSYSGVTLNSNLNIGESDGNDLGFYFLRRS